MEVYISLFGEKEKILGWLKLLEQEKVPFRYKGEKLNNFSAINILVGFSKREIKVFLRENKDKVFITGLNPTREKLIDAFRSLNLPYIHFWYYPFTSPSVFLFRIDVDYIDSKGLKNLLEVTKKYKIKGTYFLNISGEEEFDEEIGHLKLKEPTTPKRKAIIQKILAENNEIANHGYWHYVFNDFKRNNENIRQCRYYLKKLFGIRDKGFAAPGGESNITLIKAIEANKIIYSCNTISDQGEFPYYPYHKRKQWKVLEIPFYQICDAQYESIFKFSSNQSNLKEISKKLQHDYFKYTEQQIENNKPIAIIIHPHLLGKIAKVVLPTVFKKIAQSKIPSYTLNDFAEWWKKREKLKLTYRLQKDKILLRSTTPALTEIIFGKTKQILKLGKLVSIELHNVSMEKEKNSTNISYKKPLRIWEFREYKKGSLIENGIALNETGTFIWKLCDGKKTVVEIVDRLLQEYEVERNRAKKDVVRLIKLLLKEKALKLI